MTVRENYEGIVEFLKANNGPAEYVEFVESRIAQEIKSRENAKAKRLEKNGGEVKDPANSEFYTMVRDGIYKVLSTELQTGDELIAASGVKSASGKAILAAQVAIALKPYVANGTVVEGEVKRTTTNAKGLTSEVMRKAYRLA